MQVEELHMRFVVFLLPILVFAGCGIQPLSLHIAVPSTPTEDVPSVITPSPTTPPAAVPHGRSTVIASAVPSLTTTAVPKTPTFQSKQRPTATLAFPETATPTPKPQAYRTIQTDDGFVTVRTQPSSKSASVKRLSAGTIVQCISFVQGEAVFGTDRWGDCPSAGGYILSVLLVDANTPTAVPVVASNNEDEIVVATRNYLARSDSPIQPGTPYHIANICVDRGYAVATITPVNTVGEMMVVLLNRSAGRWKGLFSGPGIGLHAPGAREEFGFPADFKCLDQ